MNSHILHRFASDKNMDTLGSIEFFIVMVVILGVLGFVFLAAV